MNKIDWTSCDYIDYLDHKNIEISDLPDGVKISTMCASCKLGTEINILNIERYMQLSTDDVLCVKMNKERMRTLIPKEKKNRRASIKETPVKETNHFYNQITVIIRIGSTTQIIDWKKEPKINLKLFKNGSVQMSGCKSIYSINVVLNKLLFKLRETVAKFENGKLVEKPFIIDTDKLSINKFKIDMINSNYKVKMQIDRAKLFNLLIKKKIKSSFEPCIRACVIIKYVPIYNNPEEKEISIFIFQKGNIIITGARTQNHIVSAYKYINDILVTHYDDINKKDDELEEDLIMNIYNSILKDVNSGLISIS
jgi:TATA-box binding protein (TBP) (component of TFIID and TFIIIB)